MTKPERRLKLRHLRHANRKGWEMGLAIISFILVLLAALYGLGWILIQIGILKR